jgi:tetratricopeptide (TPR) repeat protein
MGVVYKARQTGLNRIVALKMILHAEHASDNDRRRFRAEAEAVARLHDPNIIQVYEVSEHNGLPYFSLEYCAGGSLTNKLDGTPWPAPQAAQLIQTLASAIEAAHRAGLIHRDLKPGNVLFTEAGIPKITDFGLAKRLDGSAHTQSGAVLGTPSYMAPEQAKGKTREIGPAADVYALGAVLYELLTGRPPFKAATDLDTILQVIDQEPVAVRRLQPKVPRDLETICHRCLEKEVRKRYTSAAALAEDLKRFDTGEPIRARRVRIWERAAKWARRRPAPAALSGVLLAVGVALPVAGWQFYAQSAERRQVEQKRRNEARAEARDLLAGGLTAAAGKDWSRAEELLDRVVQKIDAEPELVDLREEVEAIRAPVKGRLNALETFQRFLKDRDEALFHATLANGDDFHTNVQSARARAHSALEAVGLSAEAKGNLGLDSSFTPEEIAAITAGSYELLLMLAESEARPLPQQAADDHRKHLSQALALLYHAEVLGVQTRAIHLRRARYLKELGDTAGAEKEDRLAKDLALKTDLDPQDHFLVGQEHFSRGELPLANQEFRRALQLNSRHFWTNYFLGICCVTSAKHEVAVAHFAVCQGQRPEMVWVYLLRGFALGQIEDYAAAEADFDRALSLKPSAAARYVLYNNRGVMRVGRKESWAKGVEDLRQAAALRPDQYQAQNSLAEAYRLNGRLDEAGKHLDEALALAKRRAQAGDLGTTTLAGLYYSRARLHLQRKDREAAIRDLAEAARQAGNDRTLAARADADRGRVLHLQERFEDALKAYDAALRGDPKRVDVHRWRGELLLIKGRYAEAGRAFDAFLEKGGLPSAAIYRQRGLVRSKLDRHAEAIDDFSRALDIKPEARERAPLHLARGQEYLAVNALQPALRDFQEALGLEPKNADASLGCAFVHVRLGDTAKGVADAEEVVKGDPKDSRLWHGAARIYAQAAVLLKIEPGQEDNQARVRIQYLRRAVVLLHKALHLVPANQRRVYFRENVMTDAALYPIRGMPEFVQLAARLADQD